MANEGILRLPEQMPDDRRSAERFLRRINRVLQYDGARGLIQNTATLSSRTTTDLDTMTGLISDAGRASSQRFLNMITIGNAPSLQSTIPLTATADASTSVITIASHTLYYGGLTLVYNSGTVSGLSTSTDYYVYTDDTTLAGGAVTYLATTNYINLASSKDRYLVGAIRTPISSISAAVTGATQANPCVITTGAAHGMSTADQVTFASVGGMTQLNTLPANAITVISPTSFSLDGINSTAYGAYTTGGTVTRVTTPADGLGGGAGYGYLYDIAIYY